MAFKSKYTGQQVEDILDKADTATQTMQFTNVPASDWVEDSTYTDYGYRCDLTCERVTEADYAEVVFDLEESTSGNYAPVCDTMANAVRIYAKRDAAIIIPTIIITR